MNAINNSKITPSNNWNVCNLDVTSIKMSIENDNLCVILSSPSLVNKNYQVKVKKGILFISLFDNNYNLVKKTQFFLPYSKFNVVSKKSFIKGQLKLLLEKAPKKSKNLFYEGTA